MVIIALDASTPVTWHWLAMRYPAIGTPDPQPMSSTQRCSGGCRQKPVQPSFFWQPITPLTRPGNRVPLVAIDDTAGGRLHGG